jgi:hypothetical protein
MTMINPDRKFKIQTVTAQFLLDTLIRWTLLPLCAGFRVGDTLYLNDSDADEPGETFFAILRVGPSFKQTGRAIEFGSIAVSQMSDRQIAQAIEESWRAPLEVCDPQWRLKVTVSTDHAAFCSYCKDAK